MDGDINVDNFYDDYVKRAVWYTRIMIAHFRKSYMTEPKFVMVPNGFIDAFEAWNNSHFAAEIERQDRLMPKFMGLTVCETPKIESVYQIEVF